MLYNSFMPEWIGKTIGKVRVDKELAKGGMAEVYLGTHLTLDRPVAIKVMHNYIEADPDLQSRFEREAVALADKIRNGIDINGNENVEPVSGEGGAITAYEHAYYMADMIIFPRANETIAP
jgi:serine/threonine protein kinase